MKKVFIMFFWLCLFQASHAQQYGWDVSVGGQQYYMPIKNTTVGHWQPQFTGGATRSLNTGNTISIMLRMSYNRNKYQGDALSWQTLFQYTPVLANHLELGIGLGVGSQLSFYPSKPLKWDGSSWSPGKSTKVVMLVPLQFSLGYRNIKSNYGTFTPYIAYSTNFLFRYSPDLTPLPSASFMMGIKYLPNLNNTSK